MTQKAIEALAADREALLKIGAGLGDAEWGSESGCPGWSVQDVVAHLGALYWAVVDPSTLPEVGELPTERAQEVFVEQRRSWSSAQVLADYESVSIQALAALEGLADQEFEVPLGDLGTYPASVISSAFAFDHFLHIRSDLFAPRGPLTAHPRRPTSSTSGPRSTGSRPHCPNRTRRRWRASEPPWRSISMGRGAASSDSDPGEAASPGAAASRVRSDTASFVRWITQRTTWEAAGVDWAGHEGDLAIIRSLRVF